MHCNCLVYFAAIVDFSVFSFSFLVTQLGNVWSCTVDQAVLRSGGGWRGKVELLFCSNMFLRQLLFHNNFLGLGRGVFSIHCPLPFPAWGDIFKAPISTVKRFCFHFFLVQFSFFFLLLVSCFYTLWPFQIVL